MSNELNLDLIYNFKEVKGLCYCDTFFVEEYTRQVSCSKCGRIHDAFEVVKKFSSTSHRYKMQIELLRDEMIKKTCGT